MCKYPAGGELPAGDNKEAIVSQAKIFTSVRFRLAATAR